MFIYIIQNGRNSNNDTYCHWFSDLADANEWKQMTRQYGKNGKQSHIERFFYRFSGHRQDTASLPERLEDPVYVRFDYTRRDPLDHQAQHEYLEYSGE